MSRTNSLAVIWTLGVLFLVQPGYCSHHFPDYPVRAAGEYANKVAKAGLIVAVDQSRSRSRRHFRTFGGSVALPVAGYTRGGNLATSTGGTCTRWSDS